MKKLKSGNSVIFKMNKYGYDTTEIIGFCVDLLRFREMDLMHEEISDILNHFKSITAELEQTLKASRKNENRSVHIFIKRNLKCL